MSPPPNIIEQANALGAAGRQAEAIELVNQHVSRGDPLALFTLADWRLRGWTVPRDLAQARALFRRAGDAGLPVAAYFHTNLLASGVGGPPDWKEAMARLRAEAERDPRRRPAWSIISTMALDPNGDSVSPPARRKLSVNPDVDLFPGLFSAAECDYLCQAAQSGFAPSVVTDESGRQYPDPIRTSEGSTFHWLIEDPAIHALNRRLAAASGTLVEQGEPLQILRYSPGQQYRTHLDTVPGRENQRVATALVYLNEDYAGGETFFPHADLRVRGRKGDAIVFRNTLPDGRADPASEHAGFPVTSGTKLIASRWICQSAYCPPPGR